MIRIECRTVSARTIGNDSGLRIRLFPEVLKQPPLKIFEKRFVGR